MKLLLDTYCWLWQMLAPERLSRKVQELLLDPSNTTFLSVASMWEIAIKHSLGKLSLPLPPDQYIPDRLMAMGDLALEIEQDHVLRLTALPYHHKDFFDRLLVAQAQVEGMRLISADALIAKDDVDLLWALADGPASAAPVER